MWCLDPVKTYKHKFKYPCKALLSIILRAASCTVCMDVVGSEFHKYKFPPDSVSFIHFTCNHNYYARFDWFSHCMSQISLGQ